MSFVRPLPPLLSMRAFEAAARHLSFAQAAQEIFVTPSAISHHIQKLESDLGVALFNRRTRGVELTPAGQAYYTKIRLAFEILRHGTDEIRATASEPVKLTIGILASFAARWLAPRLNTFCHAHPNIDLQLKSDIALADVTGGEVDLAIRYGRGDWKGVHVQKFMPERLSVVCAPALIAGSKRPLEPQDLLRYPRLVSHSRHPFEWDIWAGHFGLDLNHAQTMHLHDYNIVVEAALAGQGIAMGRHRMISQQLASGALVQALPEAVLADPQIGWWLITPRTTMSEAALAFCAWLTKTADQDVQDGKY